MSNSLSHSGMLSYGQPNYVSSCPPTNSIQASHHHPSNYQHNMIPPQKMVNMPIQPHSYMYTPQTSMYMNPCHVNPHMNPQMAMMLPAGMPMPGYMTRTFPVCPTNYQFPAMPQQCAPNKVRPYTTDKKIQS